MNVTKVPCERDKSSLSMLQKFPINVTKVPHVTEVPFFRYKSAGSYGSLSLPLSLPLSLSLSLSLSYTLSERALLTDSFSDAAPS